MIFISKGLWKHIKIQINAAGEKAAGEKEKSEREEEKPIKWNEKKSWMNEI